ncbi:MAG: hypothetical protein KF688_00150 [Pirellulales bacterium]|nr:hypothetical protein [Pirellulales bacterium]
MHLHVLACRQFWAVALLALGLVASPANAVPPAAELYDIFGVTHYPEDFVEPRTEAIVVVLLDDSCPVVQQIVPTLRELDQRYNGFERDGLGRPTQLAKHPGDRVLFLGVYVKPDMGAKRMAGHASDMRIPFRVLHDSQLALVKQLGLTRLSETAVLDRDWQVHYRGPIDDQNVQGASRPGATAHYLAEAIDAVLAGGAPTIGRRPAVGCKIALDPPAPQGADLTFHRDVLPILQKHCQACHREGEVAPMQFLTYADVNAYAGMIEEVVLHERMPPFPGESSRRFAHDERLPDAARRTLLDWLRGGRAAGDPADAPAPLGWPDRDRWQIGEPDFVFRMPKPLEIPATGVLNYYYIAVPVNGGKGFPEDRWIEAIETHPGDPQVVHHVQVHEYFGPIDRDPTALDQILIYGLGIESARLLGGYTPGNEEGNNLRLNRYLSPAAAAEGKTAGIKLSKGANLMFEVHYTTNGKATIDQSEVAIRFADREPDVKLDSWFPFRSRADMLIPANLQNHSLQDLYHFGRATDGKAVLVHAIRPHMHSRGKSFRVELVDPRGLTQQVLHDFSQHGLVRGETVLSVPVWDFNWQRFYQFEEPILVRPDQALLATAYWDNTRHNPRNPDPNVDAPWGQQTIQEMFNTLLLYEPLDPDDPRAQGAVGQAVAEARR